MTFSIRGESVGKPCGGDGSRNQLLAERKIKVVLPGAVIVDRIKVIRNNAEVSTYRGDGLDVEFSWVDQRICRRSRSIERSGVVHRPVTVTLGITQADAK